MGSHLLSFGAYMGLFLGILRSYDPAKFSSEAIIPGVYFGLGSVSKWSDTKIQINSVIIFLRVVIFCHLEPVWAYFRSF